MFPKLLELGPLTLHSYGLFLALGFIAAIYTASWLRVREGQSDQDVSNAALWMVAAGIFGGRLAYVIEHWRVEFAHAPFMEVLRVDRGGLMFYGGFLGSVLAMGLYARFRREPFTAYSDLFATVLPLGHALGRAGCFLSGCCHGKTTASWMGVSFPNGSPAWKEFPACVGHDAARCATHGSLPVIPTQLVEAAANLIIFVLLFFLYRRPDRANGLTTGAYLMLYGVLRFGVELLRGDDRVTTFLALSIGQTISLGVFTAGAIFLARALCCGKRNTDATD